MPATRSGYIGVMLVLPKFRIRELECRGAVSADSGWACLPVSVRPSQAPQGIGRE